MSLLTTQSTRSTMEAISTSSINSSADKPRSAEQTRQVLTFSPSCMVAANSCSAVGHARVTNRHVGRPLSTLGGEHSVFKDEQVHLVSLVKSDERKTESGVDPLLSVRRVAHHHRYGRHLILTRPNRNCPYKRAQTLRFLSQGRPNVNERYMCSGNTNLKSMR